MEHEGMKQVDKEKKGERKQDTGREMRCRRNGWMDGETQEEEKGRICSRREGGKQIQPLKVSLFSTQHPATLVSLLR